MQIKYLAINALLAGSGLAQLQVVQSAIQSVQDSLGKLDTAIMALKDTNSATALAQASADTQQVIQKSAAAVKASQALSLQDALGLQQFQTTLTAAVQKTADDIVAKKPVLDQIGATQQAIQQLKDQKKGSTALGDAVVSKVPAIGQGIAQQTIGQTSTIIDGAITKLGGNPNQKVKRSARMPLVI